MKESGEIGDEWRREVGKEGEGEGKSEEKIRKEKEEGTGTGNERKRIRIEKVGSYRNMRK